MATAVAEHHAEHHYTSTGLPHTKIAIWAFIGSECFFFASLISTYLIYKGRSVTGPFPHTDWTDPATHILHHGVLNIPVTSSSTFVLLMSSLCMVLAHAAVERNDHKWSQIWLLATALLGATFLGFQAFEFTSFVHEGLKITTNLFGSTFFITTGFHGAHVTVGVLWLITMWFIDKKRGLGPRDAVNVDVMALYWHFVDVVWVAIFTFLYLLQ
ncbi:MAG TPA: heme-copper oxidase subunit III [Gemmatimonadaceae bacterium]|nr:heme-copper oxidase subunit III [Gemmatimonadaceae bacterium]